MEARVNNEMLIYLSKTNSWAFYETWTKEYKHWVTATVGLIIQAIPPVYPVIKSQHRAVQRSPQLLEICLWGQNEISWSSIPARVFWGVHALQGSGWILRPMEHRHHRHGMKATMGHFLWSSSGFGAIGFVLSKDRWKEMCLLSTLESVWSGRGVLSAKFFFVR